MSLLSPDTLSLFIAPDRIQAIKCVGLGRNLVEVHQRSATVQSSDNWQGMLRVAGELVRQSRPDRLHIVLSDKLVRYACFPWRFELRNASEDLAMAVLNFDDVYGTNASADWHIALSDGRPGQSRLSIAIPQTLLLALKEQLGTGRSRLTSIKTSFSATLQCHRNKLGDSGWLINLEEGRLTLGCWSNGVWSWIYSVHAEIRSPEELLARIRHEIQLASTSLKASQLLQIFIHAPAFEHLPFGQIEGVRFTALKTAVADPGAKYAFALMGVKP